MALTKNTVVGILMSLSILALCISCFSPFMALVAGGQMIDAGGTAATDVHDPGSRVDKLAKSGMKTTGSVIAFGATSLTCCCCSGIFCVTGFVYFFLGKDDHAHARNVETEALEPEAVQYKVLH
eukprot:TRINITY_DN32_c0_g1_i2.p1 TRINITY_DN32_c0_g1~~TRINITY_DN32_c0_g1_i2.p1  ORF type:complete len:124 (-),score=16.74 TRINITY_DN32_c0_g1_i2:93-464(-)